MINEYLLCARCYTSKAMSKSNKVPDLMKLRGRDK